MSVSKSIFKTGEVTIDQMRLLLTKHYSMNSLLSFTNDWNNFASFCAANQVSALPASTTAVRIFIEKQANDKKLSSIKRSLISVSHVHIACELKDPTHTLQVQSALGKIRLDKKDDSKQTEGITSSMLKELEVLLGDSNQLKDIRDLLIWNLMFELLLKRGELRELKVMDVCINSEDDCLINIGEHYYPISSFTYGLLMKWLTVSGINDGYVFRGLDRHQNINGSGLNDSSIYRVFRRANELLNHTVNFSGLSARVGAAKELAIVGYTINEIQQMGRWVSPAMPNQYIGNTVKSEEQKSLFKIKKPGV